MLDDFLVRALLGGVGLAIVAGPLGCVVVWRRMAYFGDTLAHSGLLGVALGFLLGLDLTLGVVVVCVVIAVALTLLQEQRRLATDTLLGIVSHSTLSLGLIAPVLMESSRVDLLAYLFGDVLSITAADLAWIWGGGFGVLAVLAVIWHRLIALTVDEDLARVEGVPVRWIRLCFMLLIAATIAISMKIVGILLVTSLLIIPAATARRFSPNPEAMAVIGAGLGTLAVLSGLALSLSADLPTGPSIVVSAAGLFVVGHLLPRMRSA